MTWWTFRPRKKYLAPPPKFPDSLQTPSRPLGPSRPGGPPPPPWDFQLKKSDPPTSWRLELPIPPPHAEKKKLKISETSTKMIDATSDVFSSRHNDGFGYLKAQTRTFNQRRHDRLYLHGPHPRKTMVLNRGLHPLRTMVLKIPTLAPGYRKECRGGCRGGFQDHGSEGADHGSRPWFYEGGDHAGTGDHASSDSMPCFFGENGLSLAAVCNVKHGDDSPPIWSITWAKAAEVMP